MKTWEVKHFKDKINIYGIDYLIQCYESDIMECEENIKREMERIVKIVENGKKSRVPIQKRLNRLIGYSKSLAILDYYLDSVCDLYEEMEEEKSKNQKN